MIETVAAAERCEVRCEIGTFISVVVRSNSCLYIMCTEHTVWACDNCLIMTKQLTVADRRLILIHERGAPVNSIFFIKNIQKY